MRPTFRLSAIFSLIIAILLLHSAHALAQRQIVRVTVPQYDSRIRVSMAHDRNTSGLMQDVSIKITNGTSDRLYVKIEYYANTVCGTKLTHKIGATGNGVEMKPGETIGGEGSFFDVYELAFDVTAKIGDGCKSKKIGDNEYTRITDIGYRLISIENLDEKDRQKERARIAEEQEKKQRERVAKEESDRKKEQEDRKQQEEKRKREADEKFKADQEKLKNAAALAKQQEEKAKADAGKKPATGNKATGVAEAAEAAKKIQEEESAKAKKAEEKKKAAKKEAEDPVAEEKYREALRKAILAEAEEVKGDDLAKLGSLYQNQALEKYRAAQAIFYTQRVQKKIDQITNMQELAKNVLIVGEALGGAMEDAADKINEGFSHFTEWDFNYHNGLGRGNSGASVALRTGRALYGTLAVGYHKTGKFYADVFEQGSRSVDADYMLYDISMTSYYFQMGFGFNLPVAKGWFVKPEITAFVGGCSFSGFENYQKYKPEFNSMIVGFTLGGSVTYMLPGKKIGFGISYLNMGVGLPDKRTIGTMTVGKKEEEIHYGTDLFPRLNSLGISFIVRY